MKTALITGIARVDDLLIATGHRFTGCRFIVEVAEIGIGIGPRNAVKRW